MLAGDFDAALLSLAPLAHRSATSLPTCDGGYNIAHYATEVDSMVREEARRRLRDSERANAIYAQVAEKLQGDPASVFLVHESLVTAFSLAGV